MGTAGQAATRKSHMPKILNPKAWYLAGAGAVALVAEGARRLVRRRRSDGAAGYRAADVPVEVDVEVKKPKAKKASAGAAAQPEPTAEAEKKAEAEKNAAGQTENK